jgi:glycogen synthase
MALDVGLGNWVRFAGRVTGEEKRRLLRGARLVCLPSRYETFCIAAIEALAAGKALVTTDIAELREVAGEGAALVPPDDVGALAKEVVALWSDAERRRELAARGRAVVEGLTWDRVAEEQAEFYKNAVSTNWRSVG